MGSDMVLALSSATVDRLTLFGHNAARLLGERQSLLRLPGRFPFAGEAALTSAGPVLQPRETYTVIGCRAGTQWGLQVGCNEHGLAVGYTPRFVSPGEQRRGLAGPDLVRLLLERASDARQANDIAGELIRQHGHGGETDSLLLIADPETGYVAAATARQWRVEPVAGMAVLNEACQLESGKLPTATRLDRGSLRRCRRGTQMLEGQHGHVDLAFVRRMLADHFEGSDDEIEPWSAAPQDQGLCRHCRGEESLTTATSLATQLTVSEDQFRLLWVAFGPPCTSVYFPILFEGELPAALQGEGTVWQQMHRLLEKASANRGYWLGLREVFQALQVRLERETQECLEETGNLLRLGNRGEAARLAGAFMQHTVERFEDVARTQLHDDHQPPRRTAAMRQQERNAQMTEL